MKGRAAILFICAFATGSYASSDTPSGATIGQVLFNNANREKIEALKSQGKVSITQQIAANSISQQYEVKKQLLLKTIDDSKKKDLKKRNSNVKKIFVDDLNSMPGENEKIGSITNDKISNGSAPNINKNDSTQWSVNKGQDLLNILNEWGQRAGWDIVWKSDYSYKILTSATFYNIGFITAVQRLFESMGEMNPKLYIEFYMGNKVLMITDKSKF